MTNNEKKELDRLRDIVGSLMISQFNNQEEYTEVINLIFYDWIKEKTVEMDKRNTLAIELSERTGLDIQGSEVLQDDKMETGIYKNGELKPQIIQTKLRGSNDQEYQIYLDCANDGNGGDITRNGAPLKTYDEWLNS
tara:strand:- start:205 stop:615 length:411 start_codon:yes stop_codon:yes gene_type:complete